MSGTKRVSDGEGATIAELAERLLGYHARTSLVLTGNPLTIYDIVHIKDALCRMNWERAFFDRIKSKNERPVTP